MTRMVIHTSDRTAALPGARDLVDGFGGGMRMPGCRHGGIAARAGRNVEWGSSRQPRLYRESASGLLND